jgi:DNA-binding GntR family transcriptional regulator
MIKDSVDFSSTRPQAVRPVGDMARSLPELVAELILQDILQGALLPGTRLTETALSEQHAVSRSTIREALAQLERHHFIERTPRYGARVAQVDLGEMEELFEIRASLLALGATRVIRNASDEEIERFAKMAGELELLAADDATPAVDYSHHVYAVQSFLIELSQSRWLMKLYEQIAEQTIWRAMVRYRGVGFADPERRRQSARDWRRVADAVVQRDAAEAQEATEVLLSDSLLYVQEQLSLPRRSES